MLSSSSSSSNYRLCLVPFSKGPPLPPEIPLEYDDREANCCCTTTLTERAAGGQLLQCRPPSISPLANRSHGLEKRALLCTERNSTKHARTLEVNWFLGLLSSGGTLHISPFFRMRERSPRPQKIKQGRERALTYTRVFPDTRTWRWVLSGCESGKHHYTL